MNAEQLKQLLDQRFDLLEQLIAQSERQSDCIKQNQMTDLMQILSSRQKMIEALTQVSRKLREAVGDDPESRVWKDSAERGIYRRRQEKCDQMHQDLLAIEAQCESMLQENRLEIETKMHQLDRGHHAANRYQQNDQHAQTVNTRTRGGMLDLTE